MFICCGLLRKYNYHNLTTYSFISECDNLSTALKESNKFNDYFQLMKYLPSQVLLLASEENYRTQCFKNNTNI